MSRHKRKLIVETSAVRAKVGPTTPAQEEAFEVSTNGALLYTSAYIRMEFIRRWVCTMIEMTVVIARFDDVPAALAYLEQSYSIRDVKAYVACVAEFVKANNCFQTKAAAEELARTAFHWLRRFDKYFPSRVQNRSHCQRGSKPLEIESFADIVSKLNRFHLDFKTPVTDCEVNAFLNLQNVRSEANRVLQIVTDSQVKCLKHVQKYVKRRTQITCRECERIGDFVIALEQTRMYSLAHVDESFSVLCEARGMPHVLVPSLRGAEKSKG